MHKLPELNYAYDALEPYIDEATMKIHHTKHHQAYLDKFNILLEKYPNLQDLEAKEFYAKLKDAEMDEKDKQGLINQGGGFYNHSLFWEIMGPEKAVDEKLTEEIKRDFGSVEKFQEEFTNATATHFGSGWAWLVRDEEGKLHIYSLSNQDSPWKKGHEPIIALDVWEHAYYLKYKNVRPDYIANWWKVLKLI
ncbi:MAG: superoxide dismutase [bacterium]